MNHLFSMLLLPLLLLLLVVDTRVVVASNVPVAVVVNDLSMPHVSASLSDYQYDATYPWDKQVYRGVILAHQMVEERGGLPIKGEKFHLNITIWNRAQFVGPDDAFAQTMIFSESQPAFIIMPLSTLPFQEDLDIAVATVCQSSGRCMVVPNGAGKQLFVCTDTSTSVCADRLNGRKTTTMIDTMPNAAYITESFIGRMASKQQKTMAIVASDVSYCMDAIAEAPRIAASYGIDVLFSYVQPGDTCNETSATFLVNQFQFHQPDFIIGVGGPLADQLCWNHILNAMERVDYFPKALSLMGGVISYFTTTGDEELLRRAQYIYSVAAVNAKASGYAYHAVSTPTHTELFPATENQTSVDIFNQKYIDTFGREGFDDPFYLLSNLGGGAIVILCHILELSLGVIDGVLWQKIAAQINTPSFIGTIQFDSNGQNLGLRNQLMTQIHKKDDKWDMPIVSAISRYQDVFPAPVWSARLYRAYPVDGDRLKPQLAGLYILMGIVVLFFGVLSGTMMLRSTVLQVNSIFNRKMLYVRIVCTSLSFGTGTWAFHLIALHGTVLLPTHDSIRYEIELRLPAPLAYYISVLSFVMVPCVFFYMRINRYARQQADRKIQPTFESSNGGDIHPVIEFSANVDLGSEKYIAAPSDQHVLRERFRRIPVRIYILLYANAIGWTTCTFAMQYMLLDAFSSTRPTGIGAYWVAYFIAATIPMFVSFILNDYIHNNDLVCTILQCMTPLIIYFATITSTTFGYHEGDYSSMSTTSVLLIGGLSLFISVVFLTTLLIKSDANNIEIIKSRNAMKSERNMATQALSRSLQEMQDMRYAEVQRQLREDFNHIQQIFFAEASNDDAAIWRLYKQQFDSYLAKSKSIVQQRVTRDDVNRYIESKLIIKLSPVMGGIGMTAECLSSHPLLCEWVNYACRKRITPENAFFLWVTNHYRALDDITERRELANVIFALFIADGAIMHINISANEVERVRRHLALAHVDLFVPTRAIIMQLLRTNEIAAIADDPTLNYVFEQLFSAQD